MSSWRYGSPADPDAELDYDLRADLRLRMAFAAQRLSNHSGSFVRLLGDDIGPGQDFLHSIRDMANLLEQLKTDTAMYSRAADGSWEQIGKGLDMQPGTAEQRFARDWAERQEQHAATDDREPIDPQMRHRVRDLAALDAWCEQRCPEDGPRQVTDGLIWPDEPGQPVRTLVQAEEDQIRAERDAEVRREVDAYLADRNEHLEAAMKRLAKKTGVARTPLWGDKGSSLPEYVVARDGLYLGRIRKTYLPAPSRAVRWQIEDGPDTADKDLKHLHLEDATAYLDRASARAASTAETRE